MFEGQISSHLANVLNQWERIFSGLFFRQFEDFDEFYEQICCLRREQVNYTDCDDSLIIYKL